MIRRRTRLAGVVLGALACAACAPADAGGPPSPELVTAPTEPSTATSVAAATASVPPRTTTTSAGVPVGRSARWDAFDAALESSVMRGGNVAASVALSIGDELVHTAAFGSVDAAGSAPADTDDRFRIASISKVVTAIVVLQLAQDGRLALDEPVGNRIAASLGVAAVDPDMQAVTPEQLLTHTSGIGEYSNAFFGGGATSCADAARLAMAGPVGPPGAVNYSNMNACLLGLLIEHVTALPYEEAVHRWLLNPLGITDMRLAGTVGDRGPDEVEHVSTPGRTYMEALGPAGGWIATPTDLVTILRSLDPEHEGWKPLPDDVLRLMRENPADPTRPGGFGLGLILWPDASVGHTGTLEQTHAMVLARPGGVVWAVTVSGPYPDDSDALRGMVDRALEVAFPSIPAPDDVDAPETTDAATTTVATTTTTTTTTTQPPLDPSAGRRWATFDASLSQALRADRAASVAIVEPDGGPVHAAAWGTRDPATGQAVDVGDRFRIASISKVLTAIVVLQLVEEGSVGLDEPVGERLAWAAGAAAADPDMATVTPRMLLSHTSGIPKYRGVYFGAGGASSCPEAARIAMAGAVDAARGYAYSNTNFCLLGLLVEQLTGRPYQDVVTDRVLAPLGIRGMRMAGTFDVRDDEVVHPSGAGRTYMEALGAAGAWLATPSDLVAVMRSIDPDAPGWHPLATELLHEMRTPQSIAPGEEAQYGLGLMIWPDGAVGHTGTIEQTRAMVLEEPSGAVWAVTTSGEWPGTSSRLRDAVDAALASG